jgi:hypothetical protein
MKKQDITYQDKLNELRLDMTHPNSSGRAFVLVEGETDIRLFRKFFNLDNCKVENIPGGKIKLEECISQLLTIDSLIIGIRDADFIHLGTEDYSKPNMFLTDFHDIEMTLIAEDEVFSAIIFEFTDVSKNQHDMIRKNILTSFEKISLLKWLNDTEDLRIEFGKTAFQDLISFTHFNVDFPQYFRRLMSKSPNAKITDIEVIINKMSTLKDKNPNLLQLSNGHDFIKAFSQFLREKGKINNVNDELIASIFRIKFNHEFLKKTLLYQNTKQWSDAHNCVIYL